MSHTLDGLVTELAKHQGDRPAFGHLGKSLTYTEVDVLSRRFAAWIQHCTDLAPGDRLAIQLPNCMQYPVALFGALRAGLVVVNTNPLYGEAELKHLLQDSGARALLVYEPLSGPASRVIAETNVDYVLTTQIGDLHSGWRRWLLNTCAHYRRRGGGRRMRGGTPLTEVLKTETGRHWAPAPTSELALLQYTGGTTGAAKGAMLTHASLLANVEQLRQRLQEVDTESGMTLLQPLPMYHIYSFILVMLMFSQGRYVELVPDPHDAKSLASAFERVKPSCFAGINPLFVALCQKPEFSQLDFSSLKLTISGGMALTESAARRWQDVTGCAVTEGYGLTECSPVVSVARPGMERIGSAGMPLTGTEVRIVDEQGELVPCGESGEILVRGPQLMQGYWHEPDNNGQIRTGGWLATGDIGQIDEGGEIHIIDRRKEMINVSGFKVYPSELENLISAHPDILECAVIGLPDDERGEFIKLYVVSNNPRLTARGVREYCRERLTSYKVPRSVEFRHDLPRNSIGKVMRRTLREEALVEQGENAGIDSQQARRLG
ncbi:AMP-binding protein [Marinobacterium lutimaris]|uniref:Long-chain-fatty-acid--CoA ligase n=1 Tax=Marinobacterium lutimaris TaxID=568106 RepID=A0A1H5UAI5_9GAMM|nr:AMP-binding protein [Marinobacterium lutimaris]SEF72043.1 long-chain acyl-CoA synthetase [Marinobacterium lutimaris]